MSATADPAVADLLARYDDLAPSGAGGLAGAPAGAGPRVVVNMVATLDGRTALAGRAGPLSSPADHALFHHLRALADVVLVGAGTVRAEGYGALRVDDAVAARREAAGRWPRPRLAVVTRSLDLPERTLAVDPPPLVVGVAAADPARRRALEARTEVLVAGERDVDLGEALRVLGQRGARLVLGEGGEDLNRALVGADLVDEWCVTVAPMLGGDDLGLAGRGFGGRPLTLVHAVAVGDHVFLRHRRGGGR